MGNRKKKWIKRRHRVIQRLAKFVLYPFVKIKYGASIVKNKDKRQRVILCNHQTGFDQFFVAYGFSQPVYYLASEDIFSNGFVSKLLKYAVNPIPIKKQTKDVRAVMNCLKVAKEGGTIAIFPEGNRTFSGTTEFMSNAIVKLVKSLKLPVSFFVIKGGYGVQPRWSDKVRKGKIRAYTSKTIEPEEYSAWSDEELLEVIKRELYVDEREITDEYKSPRLAEYLERVVYVCPDCGITKFESHKNLLRCHTCGKGVEYLPDKRLKGVQCDFPFASVKDWYDYQVAYINDLKIENFFETPLFADCANLFLVELYKKKSRLKKQADIVCYGNRLHIDEWVLSFDDVFAASVLGKNKVNVYYKDKVYQIKGDKRFNGVKFVNIYYRYINYVKGDKNGQFLGL